MEYVNKYPSYYKFQTETRSNPLNCQNNVLSSQQSQQQQQQHQHDETADERVRVVIGQ